MSGPEFPIVNFSPQSSHRSRYLSRRPRYKTALELSGAARLADKYLLDTLRADLVRSVVADWPKDIVEWDVLEAELEAIKMAIMSGTWEQGERYIDGLPEPASAIMFAEEFGCREILPAAFCILASIPVHNNWDGQGTELFARWKCLDSGSLLRYIRGCEHLALSHARISYCFQQGAMLTKSCVPRRILEPNASDDKPSPCYRLIKRLQDRLWGPHDVRDPYRGFRYLLEYRTYAPSYTKPKDPPVDLCNSCQMMFRAWVIEERERLWRDLPKFFDLV